MRERLGDAVGRQLFEAVGFLLFVPDVVVGGEEVVVDDGVAVLVEKGELGIGGRAGLVGRPVDLVAAGVLALPTLGRKEDRIVVATRVVVGLVLVVLPLLNEEDACLGSSVWLEGVAVETHDGENPAALGDVFADLAVGRVVETALGKDDGHAPAGAEEVDVALDEEDVAADALLGLAFFRAEFVARKELAFLDFAGEGRIGHDDVEFEIDVFAVRNLDLAELLPAFVVGVDPGLILRDGVPAAVVQRVEMQDVRVSVARDEVQGAGHADGLFVEVDGEDLVADIVGLLFALGGRREEVADLLVRVKLHLPPDMEDGVDGEARRAGGGVDHRFRRLGVEHAHAHVDDVARREILPLFALGRLAHQVFEGVVDDIEVGIEELDRFEGGDADGKVGRRQGDLGVVGKDAGPFVARLLEKRFDLLLEFDVALAGVAEPEVVVCVLRPGLLVVELGEDELEDLLEDVDAGIGEDFVLHFENEVLERLAGFRQLVLADEVGKREGLVENLGERLVGAREAGDILEEIGVLALVVGNGLAVRPDRHRRARREGVALQLLAAVLSIRLFRLDDDVGDVQVVLVAYDDVGPLRFASEEHGKLERKARKRIAVSFDKTMGVKLANDLLGREANVLFADDALDGILLAFLRVPLKHAFVEPLDLVRRKQRKAVSVRLSKNLFDHVRTPKSLPVVCGGNFVGLSMAQSLPRRRPSGKRQNADGTRNAAFHSLYPFGTSGRTNSSGRTRGNGRGTRDGNIKGGGVGGDGGCKGVEEGASPTGRQAEQ